MMLAYEVLEDTSTDWIRIGFSGAGDHCPAGSSMTAPPGPKRRDGKTGFLALAGDEEDALPLFFNRVTGEMTYTNPGHFLTLAEEVRVPTHRLIGHPHKR
jgi:hypothetical protein